MKKYFFVSILTAVGLVISVQGLAGNIKFSLIKPSASSPALTDEQQGIAAVRLAKASVVNIIGAGQTTAPSASGGGISIAPSLLATVYGTGFVLESDGLIVSNDHVVSDSGLNYTVVLADGTQYPAKIVGTDKFDDVAMLKIDAQNLIPAHLGDSSALEPGQTVFAIGNSLGEYGNTVTRGVVSALGRTVQEDSPDNSGPANRLHNLIQTDASISKGNSGGPLVNLAGEVVGINTLIDTGGAGLGFAIPINTIKDAVSQLKTFGKVSRPFLGVQFVEIDPVVKIARQLPVSDGAYVAGVTDGSPAKTAGVLPNDIITAINGIKLSQTKSLDDLIHNFQAGSQIMLTILRSGQTVNISVILGQQQ